MKILFQSLFCLLIWVDGLVAHAAPLPRVMVLVEEKNLGAYSVSEAERNLAQQLIERGIEVVDTDLVKSSTSRDKLLHAATGGPNAAAAMGLKFGAEVIVVGEAIAKGSSTTVRDSNMRSYSAVVSFKAIKTDTAKIIATNSKSVSQMHVDDITGGTLAIRKASDLAALDIIEKIVGGYDSSGNRSQPVRLLISNVYQLWQLAAIKKIVRQQANASDVVQRSFVSGVAEIDLQWKGGTSLLAEELTLAEGQYVQLRVLGITPGKLDLQVVGTSP